MNEQAYKHTLYICNLKNESKMPFANMLKDTYTFMQETSVKQQMSYKRYDKNHLKYDKCHTWQAEKTLVSFKQIK